MVVDVLFAVVDELMEQAAGLVLLSEFTIAQGGIENLVGLGIVVVHGCSRFRRSGSTFFITSEEVEDVVVLGTIELALAQVWRIEDQGTVIIFVLMDVI